MGDINHVSETVQALPAMRLKMDAFQQYMFNEDVIEDAELLTQGRPKRKLDTSRTSAPAMTDTEVSRKNKKQKPAHDAKKRASDKKPARQSQSSSTSAQTSVANKTALIPWISCSESGCTFKTKQDKYLQEHRRKVHTAAAATAEQGKEFKEVLTYQTQLQDANKRVHELETQQRDRTKAEQQAKEEEMERLRTINTKLQEQLTTKSGLDTIREAGLLTAALREHKLIPEHQAPQHQLDVLKQGLSILQQFQVLFSEMRRHHYCAFVCQVPAQSSQCTLTREDFRGEPANSPMLTEAWECRICKKLVGQHPK